MVYSAQGQKDLVVMGCVSRVYSERTPFVSDLLSLERGFNVKLCGIRIGTYMGAFNDDQLLANFIHRKRTRSSFSLDWIITFIPQVCLIHSC